MAEEYNVQLKCSEETALGLLSKTLSPTTAILTNQIQASGDVDLLKKFIEFL
jgi:putative sterol carrier protein